MYVTTASAARFPAAVTITIENADDLDLVQRIAGLNQSIPRALADRNDSKARAAAFLDDLAASLAGL